MRLANAESLTDVTAAWNELLSRSPAYSVFQTLPWHLAWWRAFGAPNELFVILAHVDARLVGIAPMMVARDRGPTGLVRRRLHFIGSTNHASDYCDFIVDPDVPEALEALLEELVSAEAFHRIDLAHFPSHSPNFARTVAYLRGRNPRTSVELQSDAPVRVLGDSESDRKAANKTSLKRHTSFFQKAGDLRFHQCSSAAEVLGFLDAFFEQHQARRALTDAPSQFHQPAQREFYRELVRAMFPSGWLRFDVVLFNGTPLAFHFGFEYRQRFIWYKPTFDVQFAAKSPGEVLIKFLLEDAIKRRLEEFDFTVGAEAFKYRFANQVRHVHRVVAFRSAADYWNQRTKYALKQRLKRNLSPGGASISAH